MLELTNTSERGVSFLLGDKIWQHQNAKELHLLAQNVKKEIIQQARTQQTMQKELKLLNSAKNAEKEQTTKRQSN